jgi:hypothetical protein
MLIPTKCTPTMGKRCFPLKAIPTTIHMRELKAIQRNQNFDIIPSTLLKLGLYTIGIEKLLIILGS